MGQAWVIYHGSNIKYVALAISRLGPSNHDAQKSVLDMGSKQK